MTIHRADGNKTLINPIINVGSDAAGDIYYRNASGIFTRLAKGSDGQYLTLSSGVPAWANVSGLSSSGYAALRSGCISWKDADEIYVEANKCTVKDYLVSWTSQLTKQLTGLANSTWYYIYLDYSELSDGATVTATEIIYSTTAPTFNATYYGWMNGDDRCIGAVLTDGSGNILQFDWKYGFYNWTECIEEINLDPADANYHDVDCSSSVPNFGKMIVYFWTYGTGANHSQHFRQNGYTPTLDIQAYGATTCSTNAWITTDTSQIFEYKVSTDSVSSFNIHIIGFQLFI